MAYNTGNPLGSTDPRDLSDNSENFDRFANGEAVSYSDRFGNTRKSIAGMDQDFDDFLAASGYAFLGDYSAGIEVTAYNQIIRETGEFWRAAAGTNLPYTTTGAGMPEGGAFVSVGDANLRQDLNGAISSGLGANLVNGATIYVGSVAELEALSLAEGVNVYLTEDGRAGEFVVKTGTPPSDPQKGIYIVLANGNYAERSTNGKLYAEWFGAVGDYDGTSGTDNTVAVQAAFLMGKKISVGKSGRFRIVGPVGIDNGTNLYEKDQFVFESDGASIVLDNTEAVFTSYASLATPESTSNLFASKIWFKNLPVEEASPSVMCNGDRLYNTRVTGCVIDSIDTIVKSFREKVGGYPDGYLQSFHIIDNEISEVRRIFDAKRGFNITFDRNNGEACTGGIYIDGDGQPAINTIRITKNVFEGGGLFLKLGGILGGEISGNYLEANSLGDTSTYSCHMMLERVGTGSYHSGLSIHSNSVQAIPPQQTDTGWLDVRLSPDPESSDVELPVCYSNWSNSYLFVSNKTVQIGLGNKLGNSASISKQRSGIPTYHGESNVSYDSRSTTFLASSHLSGGIFTVARVSIADIKSILAPLATTRSQTGTLTVMIQNLTAGLVCVGSSVAKILFVAQAPQGGGDVDDVFIGATLEAFAEVPPNTVFDTRFGSEFERHFTSPSLSVTRSGDEYLFKLSGYAAVSVANYGSADRIQSSVVLQNNGSAFGNQFRGLTKIT